MAPLAELNLAAQAAIFAAMQATLAAGTTGYLDFRYARSHEEFGVPRELPRSRGWIIERPIPGQSDCDAMGCYPLFACRDWSQLHVDLEELEETLVSLTLVTDPFGEYDEAYLQTCFPDLARPYKEHFVVDLTKPRNQVVSKHHRYEVRKALKQLSVQLHPNPPEFLDTWVGLHDHLVARHRITGVAAFSRAAFAKQLAVPGTVLMWASYRADPVAAILHMVHGETAYAHLLGCTDAGYQRGALYALIGSAIEHFTGSARWLDLMGVPGAQDAGSEGVRQFKRGWTRSTRIAWLCGRVLNRSRYIEIQKATRTSQARYFPAYREGEMARFKPTQETAGS